MENLPVYIALLFGLITATTIFIFYFAANRSRKVLAIIIGWLLVNTILAVQGFYTITDTMPPRFILAIGLPLLSIGILFATKNGQRFINNLNLRYLTLLHIIRIPVEIVLFLLFIHKTIPQIMTFEGRNLDIVSGISALAIYFFMFYKGKFNSRILLAWNIFSIVLLINIVVIAILSAPFAFQQLAFDQPNIAVLYFPFIWLPACVVPLVLFSHLASIRIILSGRRKLLAVSY